MFRLRILGLIALLILVPLSCHLPLLTAPPGSSMTLIANPTSVPPFGGVSIITAIVTEPTGTPVSDGTVVMFFTDLGQVEEMGKTTNGITRVKFVSDSRSGEAHITGVSGGEAAAPSGSTSPTTTVTATATATPTLRPTVSLTGVAFAQTSGGGVTATTKVNVGTFDLKTIILTANPQRILFEPRQSQLVANALDGNGNPLANIAIFFSVTEPAIEGPPRYESLASAGNPVYTDNNGRAYDTLYTRAGTNLQARWVQVVAQGASGVKSDPVTIQIN